MNGIIPARAGFTFRQRCRRGGTRDHPRSRGVYQTSSRSLSDDAGSSPLARGLLVRLLDDLAPRRIIPARAGFTGRRGAASRAGRDHPRSRGVYCRSMFTYWDGSGSSPLARGLPDCRPACCRASRSVRPDHPRSRGVYRLIANPFGFGIGSSPLARGLLICSGRGAGSPRIIPARAGFTPGR